MISFDESADPVGKLARTNRLTLPRSRDPQRIPYGGHEVIGSLGPHSTRCAHREPRLRLLM